MGCLPHMKWTALAVAMALCSGRVLAQEPAGAYPSRPVTLISSTAAGGPIDKEARLHAKVMGESFGQAFLVDYKSGASGTIGVAYVAKAAPDGYTLLATNSSLTLFGALYKDLTFDSVRDFAPLSLVSQRVTVLTARASFPVQTFAEFLVHLKAKPGSINYGTSGAGSATHVASAWMNIATNTTMTFVHYKGIAPVMLDMLAGRLDVSPFTLALALPQLKAGKLRALAIMNNERTKLLPGVPTIAEQGIADYSWVNWMGFLAPSATPAPIVSKLSEVFIRIAKSPEVVAMLEAEGNIPVGNTPAQFKQVIAIESARWRKVVQDVGIKLEE